DPNRDWLVVERPPPLTVNGNHAGQLIVLEHRHCQHAADTGQASEGAARTGGGEITPPAVHKGPLPVRQQRRRPTAPPTWSRPWDAAARSDSCQCQAPTIAISSSGSQTGRARSRMRSSRPWGLHEAFSSMRCIQFIASVIKAFGAPTSHADAKAIAVISRPTAGTEFGPLSVRELALR